MGIPQRYELGFTEETQFKVYDTLRAAGLSNEKARACLKELKDQGILFREMLPVAPPGYTIRHHQGPHSRSCMIQKHEHGPQCSTDCPTCGVVSDHPHMPDLLPVQEFPKGRTDIVAENKLYQEGNQGI